MTHALQSNVDRLRPGARWTGARDDSLDATAAFLREGYTYISNRCDALGADAFEARLLLEKTICMRGAEAAALFYDESKMTRVDAAPGRVVKTLFGRGGVQGLDGEAHRHRKALFLDLLGPEPIDRMVEIANQRWSENEVSWRRRRSIVLFAELRRILFESACRFAGVPVAANEVRARSGDFAVMIDGVISLGRRYVRARLGRARAEVWLASMVREVRTSPDREPRTALEAVALHRDPDGNRLDEHTAAVELINIIRPMMAVARYICFGALALHDHPEQRDRLLQPDPGGGEALTWFVQEVRRFYPFFPVVAARVRHSFSWRGLHFPEGRRVLLDLFGSNHDPRSWDRPDHFDPARFATAPHSAYELIPQGGGDLLENHRCPGESMTIAITRSAVARLARMRYRVPTQDLAVHLDRIPTRPASGFRIELD